ncbi:HAMP domain-containing sensor histidine kinase [Neobacillus sp.]|uniref:sensor histidine kinase n=1 Tax=Neobacillus sp. TaxID=2675273 RepID=UPI00289EC2CB|nr:HAMP domain-containing sensor histidine kinase [Neobacillus sp.]
MEYSDIEGSLKNKIYYEKYKNRHAQLNAVLKSMSEGIILVDNNKQIVYQNEFFNNRLFNENRKVNLKTECDLIQFLQQVTDPPIDNVDELINSDEIDIKFSIKQSNRIKYFTLNKFSVCTETDFIGNGYLLRDITKEAEIDQLKTNLITIASHEFKTPITSIRGSVETLMRQDANWDESFKQELLQGIHEDILHLQDLLSVWFDIKKIEVGTMSLNKGFFPVFQLIANTLDKLPQEIIESNKVQYVENNAEEIPLLYGDRKRLQQVLLNLIMNGIVHNDSQKKKVIITVTSDYQYVYIHVKDNGIGISTKDSKKIFDRFFRVDNSPQRKTGGTGLGLSICIGLMREHDGDILVESEPGKGSIFTLKLPIVSKGHGDQDES